MDETQRGRQNVLHTMHDCEVIRRHTLDCAGIMFVTYLIKDTLTSATPYRKAIVPEMDVISTLTTLTYLATGKMQLFSSDDLGRPQPSISKVTNMYSTFRTVLCRCSFPNFFLSMTAW